MCSQLSWAFTVGRHVVCILHTNRVEGNLKTVSPPTVGQQTTEG